MKLIVFLSLVLLICIQCKQKEMSPLERIKELETIELRNSFLEKIAGLDQIVRIESSEIEVKFGRKSQESQDAYRRIISVDSSNIELISTYLDVYGFPNKDIYSDKARLAVWIVIHHSSSDNYYRKKYFPLLYKAHLEGDFDSLAFFLGRMHDFEFGYFMSFENPYTEEIEIEALTKALNLQEIMKEIDEELEYVKKQ